ncbi:MAG: flavin reductase family protein [Pseudorhodoplanes sp.]
MHISPADLTDLEVYKLMIGSIVPRPVAWITTMTPNGLVNAAPFSAFTWASDTPPIVVISIGRRDDGQLKDTGRNIERLGEFVVNIGNQGLLTQVHLTAGDYPETVSEVEEAGLEVAPSIDIKTPRLAAAPIAYECKFLQALELGKYRSHLVLGEVVRFHVQDHLLKDGKIDIRKLDPIARIGGPNYAHVGDIITMAPSAPQLMKSKSARV